MTNKMKKLNTRNLVILILSAVLLIFIAAAVYFGVIVSDKNKEKPEPSATPAIAEQGGLEKPQETQGLDAVQVDLVEYTTYRLDELDFQFIIAKIRVKAEEPINISLSHFKTNEGTQLDQIDDFLKILDEKSLYVGKQNVWFELVSTENSYTANIFIPINSKSADTASLSLDFGKNEDLQFDLKKAAGTKEMLTYGANDVITDGKSYQMQVSNAYRISNELYRVFESGNVVSAGIPSTAQVHSFEINAVSLWGDEIAIEAATYTVEGGDTFEALGSMFYSEKEENMIGKTVHEKDSGTLFFVTYDPEHEKLTYKGVLKLKLKGQDNWIEIQVDL